MKENIHRNWTNN